MTERTSMDRLVAWFSPEAAVRRARARQVLAYYEAAKPDRTRKARRETGSGNEAVLRAGSSLRQQARHFEQNYDLALGILNTLAQNIVGANGIGVEPQPRRTDGTIDTVLAGELVKLYKDWGRQPEVTAQHSWASAQRMLCRTWVRDGEVFAQRLLGVIPALDHGTRVPYSIEMLEADYVPMDLQSTAPVVIQQGIELNAWGRPVGYRVYKTNPLETFASITAGQTKRIAAANMLHLANRTRIRQLRGVSVFATVLGRFDNLKDYEESERIAAMIAASMAAYIKKGAPEDYAATASADGTEPEQRRLKFRAGMIFDDLRPGEDIGTIDTNRPNPNLETYRNGQLRAVAAGTGPSFSSASRTYNGTYSSQRQELVESWGAYAVLAEEFIGRITRPVYEDFVNAARAAGLLGRLNGIDETTLLDAVYIPPQMPWIDPLKEVQAFAELEDRAYASGFEIIRRRGGNPMDTLDQQQRWLAEKAKRDIPPPGASTAPAQDPSADPPAAPSNAGD